MKRNLLLVAAIFAFAAGGIGTGTHVGGKRDQFRRFVDAGRQQVKIGRP